MDTGRQAGKAGQTGRTDRQGRQADRQADKADPVVARQRGRDATRGLMEAQVRQIPSVSWSADTSAGWA
jgi:hypothetical protein